MKQTVILKFGSDVVSKSTGGVRPDAIQTIASVAADLLAESIWPIIVTSGAINTGRSVIQIESYNGEEPRLQALAAIGQPLLISQFMRSLAESDAIGAQVLVTQANFDRPDDLSHIKATLTYLKNNSVIPIINENDSVATDEFATDNDMIASQLARLLQVDGLYIVTEKVKGLLDSGGNVISTVAVDQQQTFKKHITEAVSDAGRGGMMSKYEAACQAASAGVATHIINLDDLRNIVSGKLQSGTAFLT